VKKHVILELPKMCQLLNISRRLKEKKDPLTVDEAIQLMQSKVPDYESTYTYKRLMRMKALNPLYQIEVPVEGSVVKLPLKRVRLTGPLHGP
jgi:hypothetical protein